VFGLRNQTILDEVVHHEFIPQIWWNDSIPHTSTYLLAYLVRNEVMMHQSIPFHKPNKKVKSEKMMD